MYANLWSLTPLIKLVRKSGQVDKILKASPLLTDQSVRETEVRKWLVDHGKSAGERVISAPDTDVLVKDPPLFFFVLLEAHLPRGVGGEDGKRLGRLGSILVCEVVFKALLETQAFINDPESEATPKLTRRIFDGDVPQDMPALIKGIDRKVGLWTLGENGPDPSARRPSYS